MQTAALHCWLLLLLGIWWWYTCLIQLSCEKSISSNELASSDSAPPGWAAGGGLKQLWDLRRTSNKVNDFLEGLIVDLDRKLKNLHPRDTGLQWS